MKKSLLNRWLDGEFDAFGQMPQDQEGHDLTRDQKKELEQAETVRVDKMPRTKKLEEKERKAFRVWYSLVSAACCLTLAVVFLYMTAHITAYGNDNPRAHVIADRYIEQGTEETGAVNAVAAMILDYRAFDTLGESHVLFTALIVVMIMLRADKRNMRTGQEDYYRIRFEKYYPTERDPILRLTGTVHGCLILLFGIYILLNGHLGPGGGFSGGAVLGTGLIILASAAGDAAIDRFLNARRFQTASVCALGFYCLAKGYVFFTGANGLENYIPKGIPGNILSAGLILPLDIAVGFVVGLTMFGFYSLFRRGLIGGDGQNDSIIAE